MRVISSSSLLQRASVILAFGCVVAFGAAPTLHAETVVPPAILISIPDQKLAVIHGNRIAATYPVSTSKFGLGDDFGSYKTPLGLLAINQKIGGRLPLGAAIKKRAPTGEIIAVDAPGRDIIVTRILWLEGQEPGNRHAYDRGIYIHGTPEESRLGEPISWGCIRMRSRDIAQLFDIAAEGTLVEIVNQPLAKATFKLIANPPTNSPDLASQTSPRLPWPDYRLRLIADTTAIPSTFLDIRWSAGISGWSAAGMRLIVEPLASQPPLASAKVTARAL